MSIETTMLVNQANCQMAHVWQMQGFMNITFHLKNARKPVLFTKSRNRYVGILQLGPSIFFQFAGDPARDGSPRFVNICVDDIAKFDVKLEKSSSAAQSPPKQESS